MGVAMRVQEWFPVSGITELGDGNHRVAFIVHGLTKDGKRYYPKHVLEQAVADGVFDGAKMYINHADPVDEQRRGHRDLREWAATILPGTVRAVDGTVEAVCHAHNDDVLRILRDPVAKSAVGLSQDSLVRYSMGIINGSQVAVIEAIDRCNSIDFVPEGNAHGRVIEAAPKGDDMVDFASLTLDELREARPDLIEAALRESCVPSQEQQNVAEAAMDEAAEAAEAAEQCDAAAEAPEGAADDEGAAAEGEGEVTEAVGPDVPSLLAELAALRAEVAELREAESQRRYESMVREAVGQLAYLTRSEQEQVRQRLLADAVAIDTLPQRVTEVAKAVQQETQQLLRERGVRTAVSGVGATEAGTSTDYDEGVRRFCEAHGIPYIARPDANERR